MNASLNNPKKSLTSRWTFWVALVLICAAVGFGYTTINTGLSEDAGQDQPTYAVQQGPLTVSITVSGTIQARNKEVITNELEGASTIIYLIPEGERVKKGDLLVELDASSLIDQRVEQQIKVQNAEAAYINARESLAIVESQAQSDIDQAQLAYDFAVQDLDKFKEGDYPQSKKQAENTISQREEELVLAKEKAKWSKILYDEKYISQQELQTDELSVFRIEGQLEIAKGDLEVLQDFQYKRDIAQLVSDVTQAEMSLDRTKRQANANIVQASAELQAKLAEFDQQKSKLVKLEDQITKAKIYAPMDGLVVYATSVRMSFRGNNEPLEEGQTVRERQELIHLPTTSSYVVDAKLPESSLEKVHVGLPVRITVDAIPGKIFSGKVTTIAPLPNAQSIFMNPDLKLYDTQILVDGNGDDLRSGMGCQAEIIVDYFENTTYIPVQAVLRIGGKPTVFVQDGKEWVPREVGLGPDNNRLAQISSGLEKGEIVLLTPPLSAAEISDEERFKGATDIPKIMEDVKNSKNLNAAQQGNGAGQGSFNGQGGGRRGDRSGEGRQGRGMGPGFPGGGQGFPGGGQGFPGGGQGFPGGGQGMRGQGGQGGRPDFRNMTDEQREAIRKRFENMTPEEREAARRQFQSRMQSGAQGGPGRGGQGGPGRGSQGGPGQE